MPDFLSLARYFKIILASGSPRRQQLLKELGIDFTIVRRDFDESFPGNLKREQVARHLAEKKSVACSDLLSSKDILVITADTIVCLGDVLIGKPSGYDDAIRILQTLSGKMHEVFTGVCMRTQEKMELFCVRSEVYFKELSDDEIHFYVTHYQPYDKAGAYGVQDWIGLVAVEKIIGSFHNVMGMPVKELYEHLKNF